MKKSNSTNLPERDLASKIDRITHLLTVAELEAETWFANSTIYDWVAEGSIPYLLFGRSIRFDPHQIAEWLREHYVQAA